MAVDIVIFAVMCYSYMYVTHTRQEYLDIDGVHGNDVNTLVGNGENDDEMMNNDMPLEESEKRM